MAHICKNTSGLVLVIFRCQDSASSSAGHKDPSARYTVRGVALTRDTLCLYNQGEK